MKLDGIAALQNMLPSLSLKALCVAVIAPQYAGLALRLSGDAVQKQFYQMRGCRPVTLGRRRVRNAAGSVVNLMDSRAKHLAPMLSDQCRGCEEDSQHGSGELTASRFAVTFTAGLLGERNR
jgi:hypothetical protein